MAEQPGSAAPSPVQAALEVLNLATGAATAYGRQDFVDRLGVARERVSDPRVWVFVVGEYKKGKSSLVNHILGASASPVDDDVATSVPVAVRFGEVTSATVFHEPLEGREGEAVAEAVDIAQLSSFVTEAGNPGNRLGVRSAEVMLPNPLLAQGLVMVDTPGVGGLGSAHTARTMAALPRADAVLLVCDASQELTAPELDFLLTAKSLCPNLLCVLTKTDLYPEWRRILELDAGHLARAGLDVRVLPVASPLRFLAIRGKNPDLDAESGYPVLLGQIGVALRAGQQLAVRSAANDLLSVIGQLANTLSSERDVLADPERAAALVAEMQQAKQRAEQLRGGAAKWQVTLGDGVGDLTADIDHDMRTRTRDLIREAEEAIDSSDPQQSWPEFQAWLTRRSTAEVVGNYALLTERAEQLAETVTEHFAGDESEIVPAIAVVAPTERLGALGAVAGVQSAKRDIASRGIASLRSAYSGLSMFSMLGSIAGIAMNPVTLVMGVLLGRRAATEQREREITVRRQQAKQAVRKYLDDVSFEVGKDSRDTLRHLQRELRDSFSARADELQRSTAMALDAAQRGIQATDEQRRQRLQALSADLERLDGIRQRAIALAPGLAATPGGRP